MKWNSNKADDYVADFVEGISRLQLVHAETIMQPIDAYKAGHASVDLAGSKQVPASADLDQLIDVAFDTDAPIVVFENNKLVGVITKRRLLN